MPVIKSPSVPPIVEEVDTVCRKVSAGAARLRKTKDPDERRKLRDALVQVDARFRVTQADLDEAFEEAVEALRDANNPL